LSLSFFDISKIVAFLPDYREGVGQGLMIYYNDGTTCWLSQGLRSFMGGLAKFFAVSVKDMRRKYGPLIGQTNLVPLVLSPFVVFVPVKVRIPRVSGDPTYGYFRLRSVQGVVQEPEPCSLVLDGDHRLTVIQSFRTVRARLRACVNLEKILIDECCQTMDFKQQLFLAQSFLSRNFLQENGGVYGINSEEDEKGVYTMELRNLMEGLVTQRLDEVLAEESNKICRCEQCRLDMVAIALNDLPPRYVVTQRGETYSKADLLEVQRFVDVLTALAKAVKIVNNNPRH